MKIWAKQAGPWTTASLWAFWNENTQQIEDYGQAPQIGDEVYLNGFQVDALSQDINIGDGIVSNESITIGSYTTTAGGYLHCTGAAGHTYTMGLHAESGYVFYCVTGSNNATVNWVGDIYVSTTYAIRIDQNTTPNYVFQGNISLMDGCSIFNSYHPNASVINSLTINGNITNDGDQSIQAYLKNNLTNNNISTIRINGNIGKGVSITPTYLTFANVIINGRWDLTYNEIITTLTIHTLYAHNSSYIRTTTTNVNGSIYYTGQHLGVTYITLNINAPNDFRWVDITDIRINPFIIVTNWDLNNQIQYPPENRVVAGTPYAFSQKVGTFAVDYPPESVVLDRYVYDNGEKVGNMSAQAQVGCVTKEDVREGVPLLGMGEVGTCAVPSPDDVREGVPVDDTIGTLIVQAGGDRLRIANFGYYTNAQSDTYIVDLTEQDKPKFAVAEERVLIEMFPDLDLDNIPEKYFDDLFVKYLKYRLIVEYYRTAGINSTFTPSEPTTEIVNYQNVRNEVWLNSANIYLKAWAKKYPESIMKPQRILL
ncbi:MAG: hypothetical protein II027_03130 [Bacteroidales bacterium]|nr:hypothetical protein [Bacteroidales bacterium]